MSKFDIIKETNPEFIDILGQDDLNNIIDLHGNKLEVKIDTYEQGHNLDFSSLILTLTTVLSIIDTVVKILEYKKKKNENVTKDEIIETVRNTNYAIELPSDHMYKVVNSTLSNYNDD